MRKLTYIIVFAAILPLLWACDGPVNPSYSVPETYEFENVDFSGQTTRLDMLSEMTTYMKTGNTQGTVLDEQVLLDMFSNTNNPFSFTAEKQLRDKTYELDRGLYESRMAELARISAATTEASNGVAGRLSTADGGSTYLFDEQGMEPLQLIEKGLMGATFYYQATAVYLSDDKIGPTVDNTTVTPGEGTDMEHHWDEAFGYLGVPTDFPTNTEGIRFWGKYCDGRDAVLGTNERLMDAFLAGRAAISNDDTEAKEAAITTVQEVWEEVAAGTAIHYLNGGLANLTDDAKRNHELSEAIAFVEALKYNPNRKITLDQIDEVLGLIGDNLYEVRVADLNSAIDLLASIYGWETEKDSL